MNKLIVFSTFLAFLKIPGYKLFENMQEGSWTVVKFISDNSVEAVPTKWISPDNQCLWPPFTSEKILHAIKNQVIDTCWPTYKVDIFRNGTYDQYDIARGKARRAEETSDLNSESEPSKDARRKRANKRRFLSTSDEEAVSGIKSPPRLKILKKKRSVEKGYPVVNPNRSFEKASRVLHFENQPSVSTFLSKEAQEKNSNSQLPVHNNSNENHGNGVSSGSLLLEDMNQNTIPDTSLGTTLGLAQNKNKDFHSANLCTCCPIHVAYLRTILKSQQTNRSLLVEVLEQMKLQSKGHPTEEQINNNLSVFDQFILPANTPEDLLAIDNHLESSEDVFSKAVLEISRLGGKSNYDVVRRILAHFLTNELGSKYSWLGRREKQSFKSLTVARLIIEVTKFIKIGTVQDTEMSVSKWLRRASDRSKGGAHK